MPLQTSLRTFFVGDRFGKPNQMVEFECTGHVYWKGDGIYDNEGRPFVESFPFLSPMSLRWRTANASSRNTGGLHIDTGIGDAHTASKRRQIRYAWTEFVIALVQM